MQLALSKNIKKFREAKKFSQTQLARMLFVTPQTVSKWENSLAFPDIENLVKIADIFSVSVDTLLGKDTGENVSKKYIGIDGGGTKTDFVLFDESGKVYQRIKLESSSITVAGQENALAVLKSGIDTLLSSSSDVFAVFAGISGCLVSENNRIVTSFLKRTYPDLGIFVSSDIMNVIGSVRGSEKCVAVISGTGCAVFATDGAGLHRISGNGFFFDDGGSGFAMGRDAIREAILVKEGLAEESAVSRMAYEKMGCDIKENINVFYEKGANFVASFSPIIESAARLGDETGVRIFAKNMEYLGSLIGHMQKKYDCGKTVVMSGSIQKYMSLAMPYLSKETSPDTVFKLPSLPLVYGACTQCLKQMNVEYDYAVFDENFKKTLPEV